jgi:hypothetical protein
MVVTWRYSNVTSGGQPFLDLAPGGWMEESCDQLCSYLSQAEQDKQTASRRVRRVTAAGDGRSAARAL